MGYEGGADWGTMGSVSTSTDSEKPAGSAAGRPHSRRAVKPQRRGVTSLARSRGAVLGSVVALAVGGALAGTGIGLVMNDPDSDAAGPVNAIAPQVNPRTVTGEAFALAASGDCLNWTNSLRGQPEGIFATECTEPHRFEVADRVDLAAASPDDSYPEGQRRVELANELCAPAIEKFVGDRPVDPEGLFARALIPPSAEGWEAGDRSGLCGIAAKELDGSSAEIDQPYAAADQHRLWEPGTCIGIGDARTPTSTVECTEDHAFEVVGSIDVTELFPAGENPPEPADQTAITADACYNAAVEYVGDVEALRRTTLVPAQVSPISQGSWATGSRTVNCALMRVADPGPFAVLRGSARDRVTIEGEPPVVPTTTAVPQPGEVPSDTSDGGGGAQQAPAAPQGGGTAGGADAGNGQSAPQADVPVAGGEAPAAENSAPADTGNIPGLQVPGF